MSRHCPLSSLRHQVLLGEIWVTLYWKLGAELLALLGLLVSWVDKAAADAAAVDAK